MNRILSLILLISFEVSAEDICKDYPVDESQPISWLESDFNPEASQESLKALSDAVKGESIGTCQLPNALTIVEGFILKQAAISALESDEASDVVVKYNVSGFCEFIRSSRPCE